VADHIQDPIHSHSPWLRGQYSTQVSPGVLAVIIRKEMSDFGTKPGADCGQICQEVEKACLRIK